MSLPLGFILALATSLFWSPVQGIAPINVPACTFQLPSPLNANSLGQSPCQVAGYLGAVCTSAGVFTISPVDAALEYFLPATNADSCTCSNVYYSLLSACAACQGAVHRIWSAYSSNCSTVYTGYPNPVPPETAIPHWAFQSYVEPGATFNIDLAVAQGGEFYFHPCTSDNMHFRYPRNHCPWFIKEKIGGWADSRWCSWRSCFPFSFGCRCGILSSSRTTESISPAE
ncbi:hypothetical protein BDP27DRAFT_768715 [Rhodocollybia butyracea]|uniref:Uncharacterized protein n=1 Tax=Rhodocollybia butyracea TaxID=206335 RepID=A0A9P5PVC2_9AGAR|nr:hypothetical protein BDP27DRAFT_768715 [Rhodocollybia butyracea]